MDPNINTKEDDATQNILILKAKQAAQKSQSIRMFLQERRRKKMEEARHGVEATDNATDHLDNALKLMIESNNIGGGSSSLSFQRRGPNSHRQQPTISKTLI